MQIEITLEQLQNFLKKFNHARYLSLIQIAHVLDDNMDKNVFTTHDDTVHIPTKQVLRENIKAGGINHDPPRTPMKGKPYNQEYLERKRKYGYFSPHVYEEYSFKHGIDIKVDVDSLTMFLKMPETSDKDITGNFSDGSQTYPEYHEKQRSVLKLAFLRSWQEIMRTIRDRMAKEAQK